MKTIRIFTRDVSVLRPCSCAKCVAKRSPTTPTVKDRISNPTLDERKPVDLNEIHRRFWAKQAGKE